MRNVQKNVVATIAILALVLALLSTLLLAVLATLGHFVDDPQLDQPRLLRTWVILLWFIKQGAALKVTFAALFGIIGAGVVEASKLVRRQSWLLLLCAACLVGIGTCTYVMIMLGNEQAQAYFLWFGEFQTPAEIGAAVNWLFGALIGWFGAFIITLLGLRKLYPGLFGKGRSSSSHHRAASPPVPAPAGE
jgi:hypothetical protein